MILSVGNNYYKQIGCFTFPIQVCLVFHQFDIVCQGQGVRGWGLLNRQNPLSVTKGIC